MVGKFAMCSLAGALLLAGLGCAAPVLTPDQVMALRQAQTRSFPVSLDITFNATKTYLQDNFYQIRQASRENGMISAFKAQDVSAGKQFWGTVLVGNTAKKGDQFEITLTFEALDQATTQVRCNITHGESNMLGSQAGVAAVTDPAQYKSLLDGLSVEVERQNMIKAMRKDSGAK
ncbi:hypothetical protein [Mesoterricola silvestris]|uniref:Lipoprotein n=1 Tax=Mesoterricola silvestris TaxID=2927979 RepID=A0AA48GIJ2_9BACT|nr:hypothetical protein [Mesoterricola silvestris]BDU71922.1 hypothetical protein METEAL_10960 [Mesoterricola silvestris]